MTSGQSLMSNDSIGLIEKIVATVVTAMEQDAF